MRAKTITIALFMTVGLAAWAGCSASGGTTTLPGAGGDNNNNGNGNQNNGGSTDPGTGTQLPPSGPGNGSQAAKAYFVSDVYPLLSQQSADAPTPCANCHSTGVAPGGEKAPLWLSPDGAEASYSTIEQYSGIIAIPANSLIMNHGVHTGPAPSAKQKEVFTTWLTQEASERGLTGGSAPTGGGTTPPPATMTLQLALQQFGDCMDYNLWKTSGMPNLASAETGGAGNCAGCHSQGEQGNFLSANDVQTFTMNRQFPYIKRLVTGTVDNNGGFKDLTASNREVDKGNEAATCKPGPGIICHPPYALPPALQNALKTFVETTLTNWRNKTCGGDGGVKDAGGGG